MADVGKRGRRRAWRLVLIAGAMWSLQASPAAATGSASETWDPLTRTLTIRVDQGIEPGFASAGIAGSPSDPARCADCPATWSEVDRVDFHFSGGTRSPEFAVHAPWVLTGDRPEVHVYAAPRSEQADVLVAVSMRKDSLVYTPDQWNASYKVRFHDMALDFDIDGTDDVFVHAADWSTSHNYLGDGDDVVDLSGMRSVDVRKGHMDEDGDVGGCSCGGGDDVFHSSRQGRQSTTSMGPGNDRAFLYLHGYNYVYGGSGNDRLVSGPGNDILYGEDGNDDLFGGPGKDRLLQSRGGGIVNGGAGRDGLYGGDLNDVLIAGPDGALMQGGSGFDRYVGSSSTDHVLDFSGPSRVMLGAGRDVVRVNMRSRHQIDCGAGFDSAWERYSGMRNCERVAGGR